MQWITQWIPTSDDLLQIISTAFETEKQRSFENLRNSCTSQCVFWGQTRNKNYVGTLESIKSNAKIKEKERKTKRIELTETLRAKTKTLTVMI